MKTLLVLVETLMVLSITTVLGQDKKQETSEKPAPTPLPSANRLSTASRTGIASTNLPVKASDRIIGKRFAFSGPVITLIKRDDRLTAFNPFSPKNSAKGNQSDRYPSDLVLPPPRGITFFRIEF